MTAKPKKVRQEEMLEYFHYRSSDDMPKKFCGVPKWLYEHDPTSALSQFVFSVEKFDHPGLFRMEKEFTKDLKEHPRLRNMNETLILNFMNWVNDSFGARAYDIYELWLLKVPIFMTRYRINTIGSFTVFLWRLYHEPEVKKYFTLLWLSYNFNDESLIGPQKGDAMLFTSQDINNHTAHAQKFFYALELLVHSRDLLIETHEEFVRQKEEIKIIGSLDEIEKLSGLCFCDLIFFHKCLTFTFKKNIRLHQGFANISKDVADEVISFVGKNAGKDNVDSWIDYLQNYLQHCMKSRRIVVGLYPTSRVLSSNATEDPRTEGLVTFFERKVLSETYRFDEYTFCVVCKKMSRTESSLFVCNKSFCLGTNCYYKFYAGILRSPNLDTLLYSGDISQCVVKVCREVFCLSKAEVDESLLCQAVFHFFGDVTSEMFRETVCWVSSWRTRVENHVQNNNPENFAMFKDLCLFFESVNLACSVLPETDFAFNSGVMLNLARDACLLSLHERYASRENLQKALTLHSEHPKELLREDWAISGNDVLVTRPSDEDSADMTILRCKKVAFFFLLTKCRLSLNSKVHKKMSPRVKRLGKRFVLRHMFLTLKWKYTMDALLSFAKAKKNWTGMVSEITHKEDERRRTVDSHRKNSLQKMFFCAWLRNVRLAIVAKNEKIKTSYQKMMVAFLFLKLITFFKRGFEEESRRRRRVARRWKTMTAAVNFIRYLRVSAESRLAEDLIDAFAEENADKRGSLPVAQIIHVPVACLLSVPIARQVFAYKMIF